MMQGNRKEIAGLAAISTLSIFHFVAGVLSGVVAVVEMYLGFEIVSWVFAALTFLNFYWFGYWRTFLNEAEEKEQSNGD